jgi:hypothetical protein
MTYELTSFLNNIKKTSNDATSFYSPLLND